ncbi:MAG: hypothetical protein H0U32_11835 [Thermoleophilaceae bacterium]|nr:hypothetical protein [Thermoleophilaceae bacterium]
MSLARDVWINQSDSYSNFTLLVIAGWAFVIGIGAGTELARRRELPLQAKPGGLLLAAILYGAIPAAAVAIAIGAAQALAQAVF